MNQVGLSNHWILDQWLKMSLEDLEELAKDVKKYSQKHHDWIIEFIKCRYAKEI